MMFTARVRNTMESNVFSLFTMEEGSLGGAASDAYSPGHRRAGKQLASCIHAGGRSSLSQAYKIFL